MVQVTVGSGSYIRDVYRLDQQGRVEQVRVSSEDYELPPDGKYVLTCTGHGDIFELDGEWGRQEKIRLEFETDDSEPYLFDVMFTVGWGQKSRLRATVEALLGRPLVKGEQLDFDDLLGKQMNVVLIEKESQRGTPYVEFSKMSPVTAEEPEPRRSRRSGRATSNGDIPDMPDMNVDF